MKILILFALLILAAFAASFADMGYFDWRIFAAAGAGCALLFLSAVIGSLTIGKGGRDE